MQWQLFFLVMRTSKFYSFSKFQIWNTEPLFIVTMLFGKSSLFIYFTTVKFVPFTPFIHFTPPPLPSLAIPISVLCLYELVWHLRFYVQVRLHALCLFLSDSFCLACCKSIHINANGVSHFYGWIILHIYNFTYTNFSLSINKHLGCFHMLAIVNKWGCICLFELLFLFSLISTSGIPGSY